MSLDARLLGVVEAARSKKGLDIRILDVKGIATFTDTFAFVSGTSDRHNRAISDAIFDSLRLEGERPFSTEGEQTGNWILMDYGDLIIHVMDEETRRHYNLEGLWNQGQTLELPAELPPTHLA